MLPAPAADWRLNLPSSDLVWDKARNGHSAQLNTTAGAWASSARGWALTCPGTRYADADEPYWDGWQAGNRSWAAWVRITGAPGTPMRINGHAIVSKGNGHPNGIIWGLAGTTAPYRPAIHTNNANIPATTLAISDDRWHHLALTIDTPAAQLTHYLDGQAQTLAYTTPGGNQDSPLRIAGAVGCDYLTGQLNSLTAWAQTLPTIAIQAHMIITADPWASPDDRTAIAALCQAAAAAPTGAKWYRIASDIYRYADASNHRLYRDATRRIRYEVRIS